MAACLGVAGAASAADEKPVNRYPFDPACAWGRLSDGRGMVIRCLTEAESIQLRSAVTPPASSAAPATPAAPIAEPVEKRPSEARTEPVEAEVISVTADEGELTAGRKKLRVARDKYARCVSDNGGLSAADVGEVTVRFLVRERGRAEGTSVEKRHGVSEAAANCIAAVIDRRPVGTPEGPLVGATAVVRVTRSSNTRPNR